jgi:hypothetical protein
LRSNTPSDRGESHFFEPIVGSTALYTLFSFHEGAGNPLTVQFGSKSFNETGDWTDLQVSGDWDTRTFTLAEPGTFGLLLAGLIFSAIRRRQGNSTS